MSRIFKASSYSTTDEKIVLQVKSLPTKLTDQHNQRLQENVDPAIKNAEAEAQAILQDAEEMAQKIMSDASNRAEQLLEQARSDMDQWWVEKEQEAAAHAQELFEQAKEEGHHQGVEEGKIAAREEEEASVQLARNVLTDAYKTKETIINSAEPFLVELSVEVAKKIVGAELTSSPDKIVEMVRRIVRRSRVHGQITICVNHQYYQYIEEHRAQFLALLDGQAELSIYPDYTVQDEGCVIRTPFGSVDARIDTQLSEIKQVLLDIARGSETNDIT